MPAGMAFSFARSRLSPPSADAQCARGDRNPLGARVELRRHLRPYFTPAFCAACESISRRASGAVVRGVAVRPAVEGYGIPCANLLEKISSGGSNFREMDFPDKPAPPAPDAFRGGCREGSRPPQPFIS